MGKISKKRLVNFQFDHTVDRTGPRLLTDYRLLTIKKGYILPGVEVAVNLADLFQQLAKKMIKQVGK